MVCDGRRCRDRAWGCGLVLPHNYAFIYLTHLKDLPKIMSGKIRPKIRKFISNTDIEYNAAKTFHSAIKCI